MHGTILDVGELAVRDEDGTKVYGFSLVRN